MRARRQQRRQRRVVQAAGGCGGDEGAGECEDRASASGSVGLSLYLWLGGRIENENVNRARMGPLLSFLRLHAHAHDGHHGARSSVDSSSPSALDRLLLAAGWRLSTVLPAAGTPHSTCSSRRSGTARRPPSDMEWEACNGALELRKRTAGGVL
jgi:hypothetical protein